MDNAVDKDALRKAKRREVVANYRKRRIENNPIEDAKLKKTQAEKQRATRLEKREYGVDAPFLALV